MRTTLLWGPVNTKMSLLGSSYSSWNNFTYAFREENAVLFDQILNEYAEGKEGVQFDNAMNSKGENFVA